MKELSCFCKGVHLSECRNSVVCVRECSCLNVGVKLFVLVSAVV